MNKNRYGTDSSLFIDIDSWIAIKKRRRTETTDIEVRYIEDSLYEYLLPAKPFVPRLEDGLSGVFNFFVETFHVVVIDLLEEGILYAHLVTGVRGRSVAVSASTTVTCTTTTIIIRRCPLKICVTPIMEDLFEGMFNQCSKKIKL